MSVDDTASLKATAEGRNTKIEFKNSVIGGRIPDRDAEPAQMSYKVWTSRPKGTIELSKGKFEGGLEDGRVDRQSDDKAGWLHVKGTHAAAKVDATRSGSQGGFLMAAGCKGTRYKVVRPGQVKTIKDKTSWDNDGNPKSDGTYKGDGFARAGAFAFGGGKLTGAAKYVEKERNLEGGSPIATSSVSDGTPSLDSD